MSVEYFTSLRVHAYAFRQFLDLPLITRRVYALVVSGMSQSNPSAIAARSHRLRGGFSGVLRRGAPFRQL